MTTTSVFRSASFGLTLALGTIAFTNAIFTGCGDGAPKDGESGTGGYGGYGGEINTLGTCTQKEDCDAGHKCILSQVVPTTDAEVATDADTSGFCSTECYDELCSSGKECSVKGAGECEKKTCGRTIDCIDSSNEPKYCAVFETECYPTNATCKDEKDCPSLTDNDTKSTSITFECVSRKCRFSTTVMTPLAKEQAETIGRTIKLLDDNGIEYETTNNVALHFETKDDVKFRYKEKAAHFVYVTTKIPEEASEIDGYALWAAAMPQVTNAKQSRTVTWSDGVSVDKGIWAKKANAPLLNTPLFMMVFVVKNAKIIRTTDKVIQFRVGPKGFPKAGDACAESVTLQNYKKALQSTECSNPSIAMGCFSGKCRILCGGQNDGVCEYPTFCKLHRDLGLWTCSE